MRPGWVPCPGGCGAEVPEGQRCFECAAAATRQAMAEKRVKKGKK